MMEYVLVLKVKCSKCGTEDEDYVRIGQDIQTIWWPCGGPCGGSGEMQVIGFLVEQAEVTGV